MVEVAGVEPSAEDFQVFRRQCREWQRINGGVVLDAQILAASCATGVLSRWDYMQRVGSAGSAEAFLACSKPGEHGGGTSPAISREAGNSGYPPRESAAASINGQDGAEAGK